MTGKAQDGNDFDASEERLARDSTHQTTPFGEDKERPSPSDYRNPNMGPGPTGHPGPSGRADDDRPADESAPDVTREPADAESLKHTGEGYGSGDNALGRTRGGVQNISPDDHVEEAQDIDEARRRKT